METLFPQILFLGPQFAPVILRIGAAIGFALFAHNLYRERAYLATGPFFGIKPGTPLAWTAVVVASLIALAFATGVYTQGAAILGFISAVKSTALAKKFPRIYPAGRTAYFLLAILCLALIILGAGAFAIDKPY